MNHRKLHAAPTSQCALLGGGSGRADLWQFFCGFGIAIALCLWGNRAFAAESTGVEFFEKEVRPILTARCQSCHGEKKQESDLRIDSRAALLQGGSRGSALVPGKPHESLLISSVSYSNDDLQMPPKAKLPDEEITILRRWVEMGSPWPTEQTPQSQSFDLAARKTAHWAWQPVQPQQPPDVKQSEWPCGPIDRFVLARLEQAGFAPAADCDRRTFIRRIYFDLIGLPPKPEEIHAFLGDESPEAYEKVVDHLLASPRFGERWARHWFDLVRYSETYGHEYDFPIPHAWQYRDYVIRALNSDVPYDQLVREHIAGDLLPQPRLHPTDRFNESVIGTAWWFMHEQHHGPTDIRQHEADRVDNQIDVLSKAFLGLTVSCARCHDHKFDAISTRDYYALAGFIKGSLYQESYLDPHHTIANAAAELKQTHDVGNAVLHKLVPQPSERTAAEFARWLLSSDESLESPAYDAAATNPGHPMYAWATLRNTTKFTESCQSLGAKLSRDQRDRRNLAAAQWLAGDKPTSFANWFYSGWAFGDGPTRGTTWDVSASRIEAMIPGIVHSGQWSPKLCGVVRSPTFTISASQLHVRLAARKARLRLIIDNYMADQFQDLLFAGLIVSVDTDGQFKWITIRGDLGLHLGERAFLSVEDDGDGYLAVAEVVHTDGPPPANAPWSSIIPALKAGTTVSRSDLAAAYGDIWKTTLEQWHAGTIDAEQTCFLNWVLQSGFADTVGAANKLQHIRGQLQSRSQAIPAPAKVLGMAEGTGRDEQVYIRGKHQSLGNTVGRRFLEAIDGPEPLRLGPGSGRLELAGRIVDPANPFVTRTEVNRIWHLLFGRGLVATVDNLGVQGEPPTHPELLDWLAAEFVRGGWSRKQLIRQIVLSRTYRMSSRVEDPLAEERDPANLLWRRAAVRRLEGEAIRDTLLAVSSTIHDAMYGPSVPIYLDSSYTGTKGKPENIGPLDGENRRSVYVEVRRNFLSPMMLAFDTPGPFTAVPRRSVSNVPSQALIMLNDPFVTEMARRWAERLLKAADRDSPEERILQMYESALGRPPEGAEMSAAMRFIEDQATAYCVSPEQHTRDKRIWSDLAHVLFNHKEFVLRN